MTNHRYNQPRTSSSVEKLINRVITNDIDIQEFRPRIKYKCNVRPQTNQNREFRQDTSYNDHVRPRTTNSTQLAVNLPNEIEKDQEKAFVQRGRKLPRIANARIRSAVQRIDDIVKVG